MGEHGSGSVSILHTDTQSPGPPETAGFLFGYLQEEHEPWRREIQAFFCVCVCPKWCHDIVIFCGCIVGRQKTVKLQKNNLLQGAPLGLLWQLCVVCYVVVGWWMGRQSVQVFSLLAR